MDMNRVGGGVIVYVILICALGTGFSEGRRRMTETFISNGAGSISPEIDENTAEQVWMNCRQELMEMKEYILHPTEINSKSVLSTRRKAHETVSALPPRVKQSLLDCLRKKKLHSDVPHKDAGSKNWIFQCLELLFSSPSAPRRYLISLSRSKVAASHAPSPAPALAPAPKSESPSYGPAPALAPGPKLESPSYGPAPSCSPSPNPQPPIEAPKQPSAPRLNVAPDVPSKSNKNNDDEKKRTIIIIIAASGVGIFVLAALLLFCCLKRARNKISPQDGQKDERHLLTLSLSDFSDGSPQNSHGLGNSSNKDFGINSGKNLSVTNNLSIVAETSSLEGVSGNANASTLLPPLKPPPGRSASIPPGPPPPPPPKPGPRPPPPPKGGRPPPAPPTSLTGNLKTAQPSPLGPLHKGNSTSSEGDDTSGDPDAPKAKLKPFFWDKVLANPDQSMVWHEISAGSFQFNEEMIETLFGYNSDRNKNNRKTDSSSSLETLPQYIQIIDSRKAQNLSILLRALNVTTEEVCDALREGNELPTELVQTLLKMAPTTDEELKLRLFSGDPSHLGPAERFLKVLVEIPFAFKRLESLLFMSSLQEEVSNVKQSFATLEVACNKLRNSRLFLKLLEAVLKTGNRMNDGTYRGGAQAFKLDTLLKLSDVKGTDGKTTLLHFVVQEIIRSEGVRAVRTARESQSITSVKSDDFVEDSDHETAQHYRNLGLQVVSGVSTELGDVKKAAMIDTDGLMTTVSKLGHTLVKTQSFLNSEMKNLEEDSKFHCTLSSFVKQAEVDITWLLEEDKRIMALVKNTADYFHGHAGKDEGLRLFVIVRDFLVMLDKECKDVRDTAEKQAKMVPRKEASALSESSTEARKSQLSDIHHQRLFPAIKDRRMDSSSSDDDSPSP